MSRPSRDRVRFNVGPNALAKSGMADLLQEVFGISSSELCAHKDYCDGITIVCRPSQFARFLILRNDRDMPNGFKELNPVLFVPEEEKRKQPIDASGRPNEVRL